MARLIFVDTSFLYAGWIADDEHHFEARSVLDKIGAASMVITNHILGESWSLMNRRRGHGRATRFLNAISDTPRLRIAHVDPALETEALDWLRLHDEREYTFVDATSFAFMRANGITEALAFDGDFAAAGFTELRP